MDSSLPCSCWSSMLLWPLPEGSKLVHGGLFSPGSSSVCPLHLQYLLLIVVPITLHENLALIAFDSHQTCNKVGRSTIFDRWIKGIEAFYIGFNSTLMHVKGIRPFDANQRSSKVPLMHLIVIFDKTFDNQSIKGVLLLMRVKGLVQDGLWHL